MLAVTYYCAITVVLLCYYRAITVLLQMAVLSWSSQVQCHEAGL